MFRYLRSLEEILAESDETHLIFRVFLQKLNDRGGNIGRLNRLLDSIKGDKKLIDAMAKAVMSDIWKMADTPVKLWLKAEDFEIPASEFLSRYPDIKINLDLCELENNPKPGGRYQYKLWHFLKHVSSNEIVGGMNIWSGNRPEHAGWRELVAYVSMFPENDFSDCEIVAGGSNRLNNQRFFFAGAHYEPTGIQVIWTGPNANNYMRNEHFFLLRQEV